MEKYDPDEGPIGTEWLEAPEADRIDMVIEYHHRNRISLPNRRLHATIDVVVENQVALREEVVVEAFERLQREGLSVKVTGTDYGDTEIYLWVHESGLWAHGTFPRGVCRVAVACARPTSLRSWNAAGAIQRVDSRPRVFVVRISTSV